MQKLVDLNKEIKEIVPAYDYVSDYASQKYKTSVETVSRIYEVSNEKIDTARKTTEKLKKDVTCLLNQSAAEILAILEEKLGLPVEEKSKSDKILTKK